MSKTGIVHSEQIYQALICKFENKYFQIKIFFINPAWIHRSFLFKTKKCIEIFNLERHLIVLLRCSIKVQFYYSCNIFFILRQGSVLADIDIIYDKVTYQDILFVEEAVYLNSTFNGLDVQGHKLNSTSGNYVCSVCYTELWQSEANQAP